MRPSSLTGTVLLGFTALVAAPPLPAGDPAPAQAPRAVPRATYGWNVGELIPDLEATDLDGRTVRTRDWRGRKATVIVARDLDCPVSRRFMPHLAALEREWSERGVRFVHVHFNPAHDAEAILAAEKAYGLRGQFLRDVGGERLGIPLGIRSTTEVLVVDGARTLVYRGAIDDRHGLTYSRNEAGHTFLVDALNAVTAGRPVDRPQTEAPGCLLGFDRADVADAARVERDVTYHGRVSRILDRTCTGCHRSGGVGPIDLTAYDGAYFYRFMIQDVLSRGLMPPWFAAPEHGEWSNERALTAEERRDLNAWVDAGAPRGAAEEAALPLVRATGWTIGTPDAVFELPEAIPVPAEGVVDYRYVYVKTDFPEDRWVRAMEIRPTAPEVMHHVLVFLEAPDVRRRRLAGDRSARPQGGLAGYFAATVPGFEANVYPEGTAKRLPAGSWLKFQLHYTPNGTATRDRTRIGLVFADGPPEREVRTAAAAETRFEIPPGAADHAVSASVTFGRDARLLTLLPHMHLRGTAFRYELERPDGSREILLDIPRYDFNWQLDYRMAHPLDIPKGSKLTATGWFDNSADNPANPDPTATVRFGEQTFDEMMIGYFDWIALDAPAAEASEPAGEGN